MTLNFPGPQEVRVHYTVSGLTHVCRLNCVVQSILDPGLPFSSWAVQAKNESYVALDCAVDAFVTAFAALLNPTYATIDYAELWNYQFQSYVSRFYATYDIGEVGTSAFDWVPASELIFTFRTGAGGVQKVHVEDSCYAGGSSVRYADLTGPQATFANYMLSATSPWKSRDDSYPDTCIAFHPGQNEKTFKRRYRTS